MVGLSSAQLPPMKLYAGDTITYYTQMYVAGDPRGYRTAVATRVDDSLDKAAAPIAVTTDEIIPPTMMIKKVLNRDGEELKCHWRKLRTYKLVSGEFRAVSDRTRFSEAVQSIVTAAFTGAFIGDDQTHSLTSSSPTTVAAAVAHGLTDAHESDEKNAYEEKAPVTVAAAKTKGNTNPKLSALSKRPSTPPPGHLVAPTAPHKTGATSAQGHPSEEILQRANVGDDASGDLYRKNTVVLISMNTTHFYKKKAGSLNSDVKQVEEAGGELNVEDGRLESEEKAEDSVPDSPSQPEQTEQQEESSQPTPSQLVSLREILAVPTLAQREAQYYRRKVRKVDCHVSKSRKKRYQNRRAPTRSGTSIYHAHTLKVKTMKDLLRIPGMRLKLAKVRKNKPVYNAPTLPDPDDDMPEVMEPVPFPDCMAQISENIVPEGLNFGDAGDADPCLCIGDCFAHCCQSADMAFYCTPEICRLDALCSNAPRNHPGLRIYDTRRLGLGVYTTQKLWAGEIVAEYCGKLQEYEAMREGQPKEAMKQNSGFTMLLNEKTTRGNFVYIEALAAGTTARFFQHSCCPNVEFVEMQNRTQGKVLCRMVATVDVGAQITVSYGNNIWFKCACDQCWKKRPSQT